MATVKPKAGSTSTFSFTLADPRNALRNYVAQYRSCNSEQGKVYWADMARKAFSAR